MGDDGSCFVDDCCDDRRLRGGGLATGSIITLPFEPRLLTSSVRLVAVVDREYWANGGGGSESISLLWW